MPPEIVHLPHNEIPTAWYNVLADMPTPMAPPLNPGTGKPLNPDELAPIFPRALIEQEMSGERWIPIPEEVREMYKIWRPTPLVRATRLEKALKTNCRIYFKNESISPAGSHKLNTAIAQAYYNKQEGVRRVTTETGAGQWGSSMAFACQAFGLDCTVYMVKSSYHQKPYRRSLMHIWGGEVFASPSDRTQSGRDILAKMPDTPGSLGMAIAEAVEDAAQHEDTKYTLGSVLNHVIHHQSIIGLETKRQLELLGETPDTLIGCVGGGSNFGGFALPFLPEKLARKDLRIVAVEPSACPSLTKGAYAYDYGDTAKMAPIVKM
nr:TrpB-like pyridoxal phosphate-dependent enzyme [Opitutaceae bacterium]